jgi:hypothetical protein
MSVLRDPLDGYTADEIDRAVSGEHVAPHEQEFDERHGTPFCLEHLVHHVRGSVECRDASRRDSAEASTVGPVRGIRSRHSHWRRPPWQV